MESIRVYYVQYIFPACLMVLEISEQKRANAPEFLRHVYIP
jgi:hypothetical protein